MRKGMPDFPRIGGASAAEVWGYATRELTGITGTPRTNLIGADESLDAHGYTSARAIKLDNLDAAISSRSSHSATDVWAVAARTLTAFTGQPRTDLIGSDASFEAATGRPAKLDDIPYFEAVVEGSLLMNGSEQTLVEKTDDKTGLLEGMINLTPMASGDTVVVREYMQVLSTGTYAKYAEETYTGAQTIPLLQIMTRISTHDIKVTIQQTAGTYRTFEYSFVRRREA
jgi:hypothetical protein